MASIICPECGRQISDKAEVCIGCGYPVKNIKILNERTDLEKIADEVCNKHLNVTAFRNGHYNNTRMANAVKEFRKRTGLGFFESRNIIYKSVYGITFDEKRRKLKAEKKEASRQNYEGLHNTCEILQNSFGGSKIARCPKCRSTSISYQDKISLGRAAMGGLLAGSTGAVLGGLTGKKGYAVCLNCGKRWKV